MAGRVMRLGDLVGTKVVDRDGRCYGRVTELAIRAASDPPEIDRLLIGAAALAIRVGVRGWLRRLIRRRFPAYVVPWSSIETIGARIVVRERPRRWR